MNLGTNKLGCLCDLCEKEKTKYFKGKHLLPNHVEIVLQQNMCEQCWKMMVKTE